MPRKISAVHYDIVNKKKKRHFLSYSKVPKDHRAGYHLLI